MSPTLLTAFYVGISVSLSAQSITIHFDWQSSRPPIISKAKLKYNKDFAYSFTFDDASADGFTTALPLLQGGTVNGVYYPPLQYTDGCGNAQHFKAGIAWNTANRFGADVHTGNVPNLMTWTQLDHLYRLGWDVFSHSYSHKSRSSNQMTSQDYTYEVEQNRIAVKQRTTSQIEMPLFVVPSGDTNYYTPAMRAGHQIVFDQNWRLMGNRGLPTDAEMPTTTAMKIHRQILDNNGTRILDEVASKSNPNNHFWFNQFAHRIDDYQSTNSQFNLFKNHIQTIANKYGKKGSDRIWMAPLQEVYEYWMARQWVNYTIQSDNKSMTIRFDLTHLPTWMRRKTLTLLMHSGANFSKIEASQGIKVSFNGVGNTKMINLDFTDWRKENSKMVTHSSTFTQQIVSNELSTTLKVEHEDDEPAKSFIFNEMGQLMMEKNRDSWEEFDLSTLPKGLYIALTREGSKVFRYKFIKM